MELADLPTLHHPRISDLFLRKSYFKSVTYKFRARGLTSLTCWGKENFTTPLRAGRRNAYKEDARSSKETVGQLERVRESYGGSFSFSLNKKKFVFTCDSFADKFVSIPCRLIVFDDCLLADCFDVELLNSGMARLCCSH